jgi:ABC-2 type transport system permease protein
MNKISHIVKREYITRVRKRSFIIMTIIGPVLFAAFMILPFWLTQLEDSGMKTIGVTEFSDDLRPVSSESSVFKDVIPENENLKFDYLNNVEYDDIENLIEHTDYYGILVIHQNLLSRKNGEVELFVKKQPSLGIESHITKSLENFVYDKNLLSINLSPEEIDALKPNIKLKTNKYDKGEFKEQKLVDVKRGIGYAAGFLIYFFIFFFGAQVMRGVVEEKTNRIIEVIITSVRPFQLMMGKISGIALVALTQFVAWVILTVGIYQFIQTSFLSNPVSPQTHEVVTDDLMNENVENSDNMTFAENGLENIFGLIHVGEYSYILGIFLFYFIFGYLLYGAMFAAIGSAVDSETDTQQFMLPVTIPLILSLFVLINAITNPEGQLVFWFSLIPFTSPVVMMARIPFNPPVSEVILSMSILVLTFLIITWLAGKIYRIGILMYGKKVTYRELLKWLKY